MTRNILLFLIIISQAACGQPVHAKIGDAVEKGALLVEFEQ